MYDSCLVERLVSVGDGLMESPRQGLAGPCAGSMLELCPGFTALRERIEVATAVALKAKCDMTDVEEGFYRIVSIRGGR